MARGMNTLGKQKRQEELRELLAGQGHLQHVIKMVTEISTKENEINVEMVARYKIAIDTKLKLINKYLSDLKSVEIQGSGEDGELVVQVTRKRFDT
tara:strand:- start:1159 stop:1446 length:288 start_codon:yes stop_codon:yes gene_type:complete